MLHEIAPHQLNTDYKEVKAKNYDVVMCFKDNKVLLIIKEGELRLPVLADYPKDAINSEKELEYQFAIDDQGIFLYIGDKVDQLMQVNFEWHDLNVFRGLSPQYEAFAGITASQLFRWKQDNQYCGRCQTKMVNSKTERALCCPNCNKIVYPKISPAVIVAITNGNRLLMTKYAYGSYKKYALVAGYVEIGESFEEAVKREVMEEVGLKVKNIQYFKSSPWAFSDTIMVGFFAELDGDDTVTLQESELREATWFERDEIPVNPSTISISYELIECVRNNRRNM
ncbi:MAG: NAD(+) diphosphatase [Clostridiales bacterium]|nr:NAD(+) diphosphatase [Clostridiales bacterium]